VQQHVIFTCCCKQAVAIFLKMVCNNSFALSAILLLSKEAKDSHLGIQPFRQVELANLNFEDNV
jgi:hypothetical protein